MLGGEHVAKNQVAWGTSLGAAVGWCTGQQAGTDTDAGHITTT